MKKVSEFLKVEINDGLIDRIVDKCHIDKMRYMDKDVDNAKRFLVDGKPLMYRKGRCNIYFIKKQNDFVVGDSFSVDFLC